MPTPEVHAASITQRANGDMVAVWFGGTAEGHPDVGVWQSEFNGIQWSAPHEIAPSTFTSGTQGSIFNPVVYSVPDSDRLLLFYLSGPLGSAAGTMRTSNDGGATWSSAQTMIPGIHGADRNQPVLLDNGTLLTPNTNGGLNFDRTNDFGEHWLSSSSVPDPQGFGGIQPAILVHDNNTLQALGRSQSGSIVTSWSYNDGLTWSPLEQTNLPNNNSGIAAMTLDDGRHLLVYNHSATPEGAWGGPRTPLNVAISEDGITWNAALTIEDEPGEYSYPAVYQSADGKVHVVYTWNRLRIKHAVLDPDMLFLRPIIDGVWPGIAGDIDGDGFVGIADLNIVLSNWNAGAPPTGRASIPEPATAATLLLSVTAVLLKRRYI
jgi:alpha-L-rhamnosidase